MRDPRTAPQPGDVLRIVVEHFIRVNEDSGPGQVCVECEGMTRDYTLAEWQEEMVSAEVVTRAEEPK